MTPNDSTWQGALIGLDNKGGTWAVGDKGKWVAIVLPILEEE